MRDSPSTDADFTAFVAACSPTLYRSAWLLTTSAPAAEDLVQSALAGAHVHWRQGPGGRRPSRVRPWNRPQVVLEQQPPAQQWRDPGRRHAGPSEQRPGPHRTTRPDGRPARAAARGPCRGGAPLLGGLPHQLVLPRTVRRATHPGGPRDRPPSIHHLRLGDHPRGRPAADAGTVHAAADNTLHAEQSGASGQAPPLTSDQIEDLVRNATRVMPAT